MDLAEIFTVNVAAISPNRIVNSKMRCLANVAHRGIMHNLTDRMTIFTVPSSRHWW